MKRWMKWTLSVLLVLALAFTAAVLFARHSAQEKLDRCAGGEIAKEVAAEYNAEHSGEDVTPMDACIAYHFGK